MSKFIQSLPKYRVHSPNSHNNSGYDSTQLLKTQVVPHLFKIIFVLFAVFLWGLISSFICLVILIYIFIKTTSFISAHNFLCGSFIFERCDGKRQWQHKIFLTLLYQLDLSVFWKGCHSFRRLMWSDRVSGLVEFCPVYWGCG